MKKKQPTPVKDKKLPLIIVVWFDAHSAGGSETWVNWEDLERDSKTLMSITSTGWLVEETDTQITLVASFGYLGDRLTNCSGTLVIPKGCIVERVVVFDGEPK